MEIKAEELAILIQCVKSNELEIIEYQKQDIEDLKRDIDDLKKDAKDKDKDFQLVLSRLDNAQKLYRLVLSCETPADTNQVLLNYQNTHDDNEIMLKNFRPDSTQLGMGGDMIPNVR